MLSHYSDQHLRLAAGLYYLDGLAQNEVARFVKVSQDKVSRLLAAGVNAVLCAFRSRITSRVIRHSSARSARSSA